MVKKVKRRYNFLIDKGVYEEFSIFCEENGLVRGKQVELMLKEFMRKRK